MVHVYTENTFEIYVDKYIIQKDSQNILRGHFSLHNPIVIIETRTKYFHSTCDIAMLVTEIFILERIYICVYNSL